MAHDLIDSIFGSSPEDDGFYPGSKRKRREPPPPQVNEEEGAWDDNPLVRQIAGKEIELFEIGALALALGRPVSTLRRWERLGFIPQAPYRRHGRGGKGNRLYSRATVEETCRLMAKAGLMSTNRVEIGALEPLSIEIHEAWDRIHDLETHAG